MVGWRSSQYPLYEQRGHSMASTGHPKGPSHLVTLLFYPLCPPHLCLCLEHLKALCRSPSYPGTLPSMDHGSFCQWTDFLDAGCAPS